MSQIMLFNRVLMITGEIPGLSQTIRFAKQRMAEPACPRVARSWTYRVWSPRRCIMEQGLKTRRTDKMVRSEPRKYIAREIEKLDPLKDLM